MNPLEQLKDIHLPEHVSAWPPAYGWWLLVIMTLLLSGLTIYFLGKRKQQQRAKREAVLLLAILNEADAEWPRHLNELFKRTCMSYYPTEQIANKYGTHWLQFLAQQIPNKHQALFISTLTPWSNALYQAQPETLDFDAIKAQSVLWLRSFKPPKNTPQLEEAQHV